MDSNWQKYTLLTHLNCLDGAACALVFMHFGGQKENIYFSGPSHSSVESKVEKIFKNDPAANLILADVSVSKDFAEKLSDKNIYLFDHHKTAIPLQEIPWCSIEKENNRCGSLMLLDVGKELAQVSNSGLDPLCRLVDDHDRWKHKLAGTKDIADLFKALGQEGFIERFLEDASTHLSDFEFIIVNLERKNKNEYIDKLQVKIKQIDGFRIGVCFCEQHISDAGHAICDKYDLDAAVLVSSTSISMRAPDCSKIDLSKIAQKYKGGGHRCAAGFQTQDILGKSLLDMVIEKFSVS